MTSVSGPSRSWVARMAGVALVIWLVLLCVVPDPRPLAAPEWAVRLASRATGLGGPPSPPWSW